MDLDDPDDSTRDDPLMTPDRSVNDARDGGFGSGKRRAGCEQDREHARGPKPGPRQRKRPVIGTSKGIKKARVAKVTLSKSLSVGRTSETPPKGNLQSQPPCEILDEAAPTDERPSGALGEKGDEGRRSQGGTLQNLPPHSGDLTRREKIPMPRSTRIRESPARSPSTKPSKTHRRGGKAQRVSPNPGGEYWSHWSIGKESNPLDPEVARQLVAGICLPSVEEFYLLSKRVELYCILETDLVRERLKESLQVEKDKATGEKGHLEEALKVEKARSKGLASQVEDLTSKCGNLVAQVHSLLSDKDEMEVGIFDSIEKALSDFKKSRDLEVYVAEDPTMKGFHL
ncbi:hypothetical protein NE237_021617 [Protea cynaroides]|uniref:Uncharacterized protein n=1 Tax=Protea cynaroides TaxID=273540 RepID=A0A9Q0HCR5_9MAGN|nr:hypothetical protein NE237_021617 [Protea cynaroides]